MTCVNYVKVIKQFSIVVDDLLFLLGLEKTFFLREKATIEQQITKCSNHQFIDIIEVHVGSYLSIILK